jgi:colanic acid biosynthesis glycosyl transferase WcaI
MRDWLTNRGHEVHVVTAPPFYQEWQVRDGYSAWAYRRERIAGVGVCRSAAWIPAGPSAMKRLLHLTSLSLWAVGNVFGQCGPFPKSAVVGPQVSMIHFCMSLVHLLDSRRGIHDQA